MTTFSGSTTGSPRRLSTWAVTLYTPGWVLMMFWEVMRMLLLMSPSSTSVAVSRSSRVTVWFMEYTRGRDRAKRGAS